MRRYRISRALAAVVTLAFAACSSKNTPPPPPEHRTVVVTHGALQFVPDTPAAQRVATANEISAFLEKLYSKAFIAQEAKGPTPVPDDASTRAIGSFFMPGARQKLDTSSVFRLGPHLDLLTGHAAYNGGVTTDGSQTTALLGITFTGSGSRTDEGARVVDFSQSGTLRLQRTEAGWLVRTFDLAITLTPPPPTPTPT